MANMVYHELCCKNLKQKLAAAGVICSKTLKSKSAPEGHFYPHVLCYDNCNADAWFIQKNRILKSGVVDYAKKNPDGTSGVRRDYTPEEQSELGFYPVEFSKGGNKMTWACRWVSNDDPAFYASSVLPDDTLIFTEIYEDGCDDGCYIKRGKKVADKPLVDPANADNDMKKLFDMTYRALIEAKLENFATEAKRRSSLCKTYDEILSMVADYVDFDAPPKEEEDDEEEYEF